MKYRQLGSTDLTVSLLGFGCWAAGNEWTDTSDGESIRAIHQALDVGITFFDVAPIYGKGHAEEVLGRALGNRRQDVVIASKCGLEWDGHGNNWRNLKPDRLRQEIDDSLRRLGTDYLDVYQIHWPDPNTPIGQTMEALVQIKEQGKVRHLAVSNFSVSLMARAMEYSTIVSNQVLYNMIDRNSDDYHGLPLEYRTEWEVIPFCTENKVSVIPYSPLAQGLLTGKLRMDALRKDDVRWSNPQLQGRRLEKNQRKVEQLQVLADQWQRPLVEVAINWLAYQPIVGPIIAGVSHVEQVDSNARALEWELTPDQYEAIQAILQTE